MCRWRSGEGPAHTLPARAVARCCLFVLLCVTQRSTRCHACTSLLRTSLLHRSALSLAGFCALLRHLGRLTAGLFEALAVGATTRQVWVPKLRKEAPDAAHMAPAKGQASASIHRLTQPTTSYPTPLPCRNPSVCLQELSLLQPWCPGVTATTAMQRTMSVHSNQYDTIRAAAAAAAGTSQQQQSAVLSIMAASLGAMWDAVGEEGMRPFVVRGGGQSECVVSLPVTCAAPTLRMLPDVTCRLTASSWRRLLPPWPLSCGGTPSRCALPAAWRVSTPAHRL